MHLVDDGRFNFLNDPSLLIPAAHARSVCCVERAKELGPDKVCRYVGHIPTGFICAKNTPLRLTIDKAVADGKYDRATGNNCDGFSSNP